MKVRRAIRTIVWTAVALYVYRRQERLARRQAMWQQFNRKDVG